MIYKVSDTALVPEGVHTGKLIQIVEIKTKIGPAAKFVFLLVDSQQIVSGICSSLSLTPGSKLYQWLSVVNGSNLDLGCEVDTENLVGAKVELITQNIVRDGRMYSNVSELVRLIAPADNSELGNAELT